MDELSSADYPRTNARVLEREFRKDPEALKKIGVGLAALGSAIGVGLVGAKAAEATGRNPGAAGEIRTQAIIFAALAEVTSTNRCKDMPRLETPSLKVMPTLVSAPLWPPVTSEMVRPSIFNSQDVQYSSVAIVLNPPLTMPFHRVCRSSSDFNEG